MPDASGKCDLCGKTLKNLKRHKRETHESKSSQNCKYCHKSSSRKDNLMRHYKICEKITEEERLFELSRTNKNKKDAQLQRSVSQPTNRSSIDFIVNSRSDDPSMNIKAFYPGSGMTSLPSSMPMPINGPSSGSSGPSSGHSSSYRGSFSGGNSSYGSLTEMMSGSFVSTTPNTNTGSWYGSGSSSNSNSLIVNNGVQLPPIENLISSPVKEIDNSNTRKRRSRDEKDRKSAIKVDFLINKSDQ